jgi:hypothetical protein
VKIKPNFYIDFHRQLIRETLDYAYKNEYVTFDIVKKMVAPVRFINKELSEEDIHYIFKLLVNENYLIPDMPVKGHYEITDKGRIFYLIKFW